MQRKKAHRTLPRFPRLIPIVFPAVVMIERCRPLCSLKSLTKNPAWAVNAASSFSAQYSEKLLNIWMKFDKHKSIYLLRFVDSYNSIASGEEEEELFTITNSTKSLEGSSGSAMLHLIENSDNERSRLHFCQKGRPRASDVPVTCAPCEIGVSMLIQLVRHAQTQAVKMSSCRRPKRVPCNPQFTFYGVHFEALVLWPKSYDFDSDNFLLVLKLKYLL